MANKGTPVDHLPEKVSISYRPQGGREKRGGGGLCSFMASHNYRSTSQLIYAAITGRLDFVAGGTMESKDR